MDLKESLSRFNAEQLVTLIGLWHRAENKRRFGTFTNLVEKASPTGPTGICLQIGVAMTTTDFGPFDDTYLHEQEAFEEVLFTRLDEKRKGIPFQS